VNAVVAVVVVPVSAADGGGAGGGGNGMALGEAAPVSETPSPLGTSASARPCSSARAGARAPSLPEMAEVVSLATPGLSLCGGDVESGRTGAGCHTTAGGTDGGIGNIATSTREGLASALFRGITSAATAPLAQCGARQSTAVELTEMPPSMKAEVGADRGAGGASVCGEVAAPEELVEVAPADGASPVIDAVEKVPARSASRTMSSLVEVVAVVAVVAESPDSSRRTGTAGRP